MSIADQILALTTDRTNIRNAILAKGGICASENGFDDFASDIATIPSGGGTEQSKSMLLGASTPLTVTPDSGYVLSSVAPNIDTSIIKAENIAQGISILGITGTHQGGGSGTYITISSEAPTSAMGNNGDLWLVLEEN